MKTQKRRQTGDWKRGRENKIREYVEMSRISEVMIKHWQNIIGNITESKTLWLGIIKQKRDTYGMSENKIKRRYIYIYIKRQRHRQKNDNWTRETEKKERRDTQAKGMNIRINI